MALGASKLSLFPLWPFLRSLEPPSRRPVRSPDGVVWPYKARVCRQRDYHNPRRHPMSTGGQHRREPRAVDYNPRFLPFPDHFSTFPGHTTFFVPGLPTSLSVPKDGPGCLRPSFIAQFGLPLLAWNNPRFIHYGFYMALYGPSKARVCLPWDYHNTWVHPMSTGAWPRWEPGAIYYNSRFFLFWAHFSSRRLFSSRTFPGSPGCLRMAPSALDFSSLPNLAFP